MLVTTHNPIDVDELAGYVLEHGDGDPTLVIQCGMRATVHLRLVDVEPLLKLVTRLADEAEHVSPS